MIAMNEDMARTIGDLTSSFIGRTIARMISSLWDVSLASFERRPGLPVSLRRRATLRLRIAGAYVSRMKIMHTTVNTPDWKRISIGNITRRDEQTRIVRSQNTHLHPIAWTRNPPATGPTTGPNNGPAVHIAMALPLRAVGIVSAMVPAPIVKHVTPKQPDNSLNAINMPMLSATAQAMVKMKKPTFPTW